MNAMFGTTKRLIFAFAMFAAWGLGPPSSGAQEQIPVIAGQYDINELRRLIEIARESGFSEKQIEDITVEDEEGNVIKAWAFIQDYDRRKKEEAERLAAQRAKVYLTPQEIIDELDEKQPKDIDDLREKMLFIQ